MEFVGITTTIPVEVIYAAGAVPIDLNNLFITTQKPEDLVLKAEEDGLPRNLCSWVKGIYSTILRNPKIKKVIAVTEGDCTNTLSMLDLLSSKGIEVVTFAYPFDREKDKIDGAIRGLEDFFGVKRKDTEKWRKYLNSIRKKAFIVDRMTWDDKLISGFENHISLISCSDFEGSPDKYEEKLDDLIKRAKNRKPFNFSVCIGFCGVPSIYSDLYTVLENLDVGVVYNEVQRQFAMPFETDNIVEQYLRYTYPYTNLNRIKDINSQVKKRDIKGMIHYVQSFCHHQIHARKMREEINCPVVTLEGDRPGQVIERSKIRLESFIEMLNLA